MKQQMTFRLDRSRSGEGRQYFIKCHGLGNDFVVIDGRSRAFAATPACTRWICDRHVGIGGEQLLVLEPPQATGVTVRLRIYNIDGQEAETCLNATRCAAWLVMEESGAEAAVIETAGGLIDARRAGPRQVQLTIGTARFDWADIPLAGPAEAAGAALENGPLVQPVAVNIGNPHLVYFVPDRDALDVAALADPIQKSAYLPEQANIGVAEITGAATLKLVVYERPGILTRACGSGACAAVLAARRTGRLAADSVSVAMPGGTLVVTVLDGERVTLTGAVEMSFDGHIASSLCA